MREDARQPLMGKQNKWESWSRARRRMTSATVGAGLQLAAAVGVAAGLAVGEGTHVREAERGVALASEGLGGAVPVAQLLPERLAGGHRGRDVDNGVPEALQGEHEGGGVVESEVESGWVGERVDSVDG